jgi:hypothetical protein
MKALLTAAGFTDIIENTDGTVDATKDGIRYSKMYMSDWSLGIVKGSSVVTQDVSISYCK